MLVSESESQSTSTFLLVRQLPGAIELAGTFFPADGYVLLQDHGDIHLVCKARYSHSCGWLDGKEIRKDIPDPAPYSAEAMSWHIEATRRDWIGEFIPGEQAAGAACDLRDRLTPPTGLRGGTRSPLAFLRKTILARETSAAHQDRQC